MYTALTDCHMADFEKCAFVPRLTPKQAFAIMVANISTNRKIFACILKELHSHFRQLAKSLTRQF